MHTCTVGLKHEMYGFKSLCKIPCEQFCYPPRTIPEVLYSDYSVCCSFHRELLFEYLTAAVEFSFMSSDEALAVLTFIGMVSVVIRPATIHFSTIYDTYPDTVVTI